MDNQKKKIVIIDDEISFLNIFETLLKNAGFEIKTFSNPKTALQEIVGEKPDLILLDVKMPEMDGFQVFECLKKDFGEKAPKIIFLTNLKETVSGGEIDEHFAKDIGAQGYIYKVEDLNKILERVKKALKD